MTPRRNQLLLAAALAAAVAAAGASGFTGLWELPLRDALLRASPRPPSEKFAVVAIDEVSLEQLGAWPWPRTRLAELVDAVRAAGARAIALDLILPGEAPDDPLLATALGRGPALLAAGLRANETWLLPSVTLAASARLAHAHLERDGDGVLRRIAGTKQAEGRALPAFAAAAAALAGSATPIPLGGTLVPSFRASPKSIRTISAIDLMRKPRALDERVVFIGVTAAGIGDRVPVPSTAPGQLDYGVQIQAAAADALWRGDRLRAISPLVGGMIAFTLAALAGIIGCQGGWRRIASGLALCVGTALLAALLLVGANLELPIATLTLAAAVPWSLALARDEAHVARRAQAALEQLGSGVPGSTAERVDRLSRLSEQLARDRGAGDEQRRAVVHELKTPVASIRGLAQLLAEFELSPDESRRIAEMVGTESDRLAGMVDGLLGVERIGLHDLEREGVRLSLGELVTERVELQQRASGRAFVLDAPLPVTVLGIRQLLAQAIDNVLTNAMQYSPPDSPIRVRIQADGEARIEIEDRGPGVADIERAEIFQRFRRGAAARDTPGMGLGLALVAEICALHRGHVDVDSAAGGGAVFRLHLPRTAN